MLKSSAILFWTIFIMVNPLRANLSGNGQAGPSGWTCHIIQADPEDEGPDGMNWHDWNGDGYPDVLVNYEEGHKSRLFFNPGPEFIRQAWTQFIEFPHGKCEDSGMGDLDGDGDIDYIANGGIVYFNPGKKRVEFIKEWKKMTLFEHEARAPIVIDLDQDGLNDLLVAGSHWYKQPQQQKHDATKWKKFILGQASWVMNQIPHDMDKDGLIDLVIQDRRNETFWYKNPGLTHITSPWPRYSLFKNNDSMFMMIKDINQDQRDDLIICCGRNGSIHKKVVLLLRTNSKGNPTFKKVFLDPAKTDYFEDKDYFPKGVAYFDIDDNPNNKEIVVQPKKGDPWCIIPKTHLGEITTWNTKTIEVPGGTKRMKMDNIYLADIDNDGDTDFGTTEENGGWGVIWFENPKNLSKDFPK